MHFLVRCKQSDCNWGAVLAVPAQVYDAKISDPFSPVPKVSVGTKTTHPSSTCIPPQPPQKGLHTQLVSHLGSANEAQTQNVPDKSLSRLFGWLSWDQSSAQPHP